MPKSADLRFLWIVCLILCPLVLVVIELFHPAGFTRDPGMFEYLRGAHPHTEAHKALDYFGPDWWFWLHMIQTPTVCLIAVGLILTAGALAARGDGLPATLLSWLARAAIFVFAVYYTALDAIGGIGLGRTLEIVNALAAADPPDPHLTPEQVEGVGRVLNLTWTDPWVGGVGSLISQTGSWAIFAGTVLLALTAIAAGRARLGVIGWLSLAALVAGGWFVQESHACCTGPIGFGLIFVFGCLTWWADRAAPAA